MEPKKYSSYADIDRDLEILKLERELHYQKTILSIEKTKESIVPSNTISFAKSVYKNVLSGTLGSVLRFAIPFAINWFINRKRGD